MKNFIKFMSLIAMAVLALTLTSCNESYDFYKDWSQAGANIEEDNIYSTLTLEEAEAKIEANEKFIVLVASSQSSLARGTVATLQTQAEYLSYEGEIFFVDATDYVSTSLLRGTLKKGLKLKKNYSAVSDQAIVACYENGGIVLDTSDTNEDRGQYYLLNGTVNFERLAYYLFTKF